MSRHRRGPWAKLLAWMVLSALAPGCAFLTLKEDVEQASTLATAEGHAAVRGAETSSIVVVLYAPSEQRIVDLFMLPRAERFYFSVPAGTYRLAAFEDRNRDAVYQPEQEAAAVQRADVVLRPGEQRTDLDLVIDPSARERIPFAVTGLAPERRDATQLPSLQLGTIVDIDDPRFSAENGKLGLWNPLEFLYRVGGGVYFLGEYDPSKIPVLFVHGAVGNPGNWKYLISQLDRSRFQPWLFYYPSAPRLEAVARALVRALAALQVRHGFSQLIIVAHSMGGLVSRAAINYARGDPNAHAVVRLDALVTISSPWNGVASAEEGVEHAPVVAPSWEDMAPGSPFLASLPETALPPECEYSLLFSYRGGRGLGGEANDGTVAVSSELSLAIQRQALRVIGFDESHSSILRSAEVATELNGMLARTIMRDDRRP